jgi:membrane peptidoglycan carboxypeptidase
VGFQPTCCHATWVGYDTPRNLGSHEGTGAGSAIWIDFMKKHSRCAPDSMQAARGRYQCGRRLVLRGNSVRAGRERAGLNDRWPGRPELAYPRWRGPPPSVPPPPEDRRSGDLFGTERPATSRAWAKHRGGLYRALQPHLVAQDLDVVARESFVTNSDLGGLPTMPQSAPGES